MAYEARRNDDEELTKEEQKARNDANNARVARAALDVADKVPLDPAAEAVVKGVKAADDITGGAVSNIAGKAMTISNNAMPTGRKKQEALNKFSESGALDAAGKAMDAYDKAKGSGAKGDSPNQVKKPGEGGEQNSSLPSSADKNNHEQQGVKQKEEEKNKEDNKSAPERKKDDESGDNKKREGLFGVSGVSKFIMLTIGPALIVIIFIVVLIVSVLGVFSDYDDAFGISAMQGENTGGIVFSASDPEQLSFYERVLEVKNTYQASGKTVDPLKIVSAYHVLKNNGANLSYEVMTIEVISDFADCLFLDNNYSDEIYRNNLITYLIPKYLPSSSDEQREDMADEVFNYIERYYDLIGKEIPSSCSSTGSCIYDIKGFYIKGKGNVKKEMTVNDLYVRLMQCGTSDGHNYGGTYGQPLAGEELVPFEKYILGVAYQEIGPNAPENAFKAQMIAARSYILARPTDMGGWRTLQEENGKWIIQVASCTADQVYCDPDKGCSTASGGNGQWYQVHSGTNSGRILKNPLPDNSPLRQYAADVQGEVLVNNQDYIISTGYVNTESNQFISLARSGYDYKQVLLQVYNQGSRNYGATNIHKYSCGNCVSNGFYTNWKQYEGPWINVTLGTSGKTISQIGCLATSISIQIAKSGVATNVDDFNPGTFVEFLSNQNAFSNSGSLNSYASVETIAPTFKYQGYIDLSGRSRADKLNEIRNLVSQQGIYAVAEVKGNTGQHWVAIDSVDGDTINMMDPGSSATNMWSEYNWANTSRVVYYMVG